MTRLLSVLMFLAVVITVSAQDVKFSGQLRERTEFSGKAFVEGASTDVYHLLRTRLNATATLENAAVVFELQDARMFGSELNSLNEGNLYQRANGGIDLTQAYLSVTDLGGTGIAAKAGRMGLEYGNYRYVGRQDASNLTQSFDGGALSFAHGPLKVEAFAAAIRRRDGFFSVNDMRIIYQRDEFLGGLWAAWKDENGTYHMFGFFDNPRYMQSTQSQTQRFTAGAQLDQTFGVVGVGLEGAYQFGQLGEMPSGFPWNADIAAYFFAARAGIQIPGFERLRVEASIERMSGNDAPADGERDTKFEQFSTLYGNRFKFFGNMNVFNGEYFSSSAIRNNGLQDVSVSVTSMLVPGLALGTVAHVFHETVDPKTYIAKDFDGYDSFLGYETDITMTYQVFAALKATTAFCLFDAGKERASYYNIRRTTKWAYVLFLLTI